MHGRAGGVGGNSSGALRASTHVGFVVDRLVASQHPRLHPGGPTLTVGVLVDRNRDLQRGFLRAMVRQGVSSAKDFGE